MNFSAEKSSGTFALLPAGLHNAKIFAVCLVGNIPNRFRQGERTHTLYIGFEIAPTVPGGRTTTRWEEYQASMSPNAKLRKVVEACENRGFGQVEASSYKIENLVGKTCRVTIIHNVSKTDPTKIYANTAGVSFSDVQFQTFKKPLVWDVEKDPVSVLPEHLQRVAMTSTEWQAKNGTPTAPQYAMGQAIPNTSVNWQPAPAVHQPVATAKPVEQTVSFDFE